MVRWDDTSKLDVWSIILGYRRPETAMLRFSVTGDQQSYLA